MLVLAGECVSIEDYFFLCLLWLEHTACDHVRLKLAALSVAIDQRHLTLDLLRLARENHLAQHLRLFAFL